MGIKKVTEELTEKMTSELELSVRYAETDQSGRVYHANYLMYLDLARTDFLSQLGLDYSNVEKQGVLFVVSQVQAQYLKPIEFFDKIKIITKLEAVKRASLEFSYDMYCKQQLVFKATTKLACISSEGKVIKIPDEILQKIS